MRLGVLATLTRENIAIARRLGYDGLEVDAGWLDQPRMDELEAGLPELKAELEQSQLRVTSVAVYGDAIGAPVEAAVGHYERAIAIAQKLGARVVSGITGRDNDRSLGENLALFAERFEPIAERAAMAGMRIALEPWPGRITGYGGYRWANLAISPLLYDQLFERVPNVALGIEYDPSHYAWQGIDYLAIVADYAERIHHLHAKDVLLDKALLKRGGVHAEGWWRFCLPGLGQIDWPGLFDALAASGYQGDVAVEHEDRAYGGERRAEGLELALKTLRPFVDSYSV